MRLKVLNLLLCKKCGEIDKNPTLIKNTKTT